MGCDKLCMLRDVAKEQTSSHPSIVARIPKELLPNVVVASALGPPAEARPERAACPAPRPAPCRASPARRCARRGTAGSPRCRWRFAR